MAVGAFAEFMAKPPYNLIEASPWPIHYESATGFFWIPARLSLPFVLERVLVLCSGEGPANYKTTIKKRDESIVLLKKNQQVIGEISQVYSAMASGEWLCYRYVPKLIAGKIASLLGGKLIEMGNNMVSERMESKNVS